MNDINSTIRSVKRQWGWMLAYGILLVVTGIFALMAPGVTAIAVSAILFATFMISGIGTLLAAFRDAGWQAKLVDLLFGILALLAAFLCIANPFGSAVTLVWIAGIFFIVNGISELVGASRAGDDKGMLILLGAIDLLLGIYLAFFIGPLAALATLAFVVGLGFIFRGIVVSILAFKVRGLTSRLRS